MEPNKPRPWLLVALCALLLAFMIVPACAALLGYGGDSRAAPCNCILDDDQ